MANDRRWTIAILDAAVYAAAVTVVVLLLSTLLSLPFGGAATTVKRWLFFLGWLTLGYATLLLWPSRTEQSRGEPVRRRSRPDEETSFQRAVKRIPPLRRVTVRRDDELSDGTKLFLASALILSTSLAMEVVLGVGH